MSGFPRPALSSRFWRRARANSDPAKLDVGAGDRPSIRPSPHPWRERLRRWAITGGFGALGLICAAATADRVAPPKLARAEDRSIVVADASGAMLRPFLASDGIWRLPVDETAVDPLFLKLLFAYEDQRFEGHPGVDALAIGRAAWQLLSNMRVVSGASTLTMQVARLLEPRPRNLGSKAIEAMRALQLEAHYSKDEILRLYLTLAPYGGNLEGVRAASLAYFGKEPKHLSLSEAALLVALPQSPERQRPDRAPKEARAGRDKVLTRLAERGVIEWDAANEAMSDDVPNARRKFPFHAPHLSERLAAQKDAEDVILTTIDGKSQDALERLAKTERAYFKDSADIAVVVVDNRDHGVVAHLGSSDYWGQFGQIDLTQAVRSPGSTLKPFIYGVAFDDLAIHPMTLIDDKPMIFGDYAPRNFDRGFQGTVTFKMALQESLNVPAVSLLDKIGPVRLAAMMRNAGAKLTFARSWTVPSLPMALGGVGITLSDLTMLYSAIPDKGTATTLRVRKSDPQAAGVRMFGETAAWYLKDILAGSPLPDGWAMGRGIERRRRVAFKTGTSYGHRDAWSVGFTDRYTVGVWVGRADGSTRPGRFGRNEAAPLLLKVFDLLPPETRTIAPPPVDVIVVNRTEELPRAMQRFRPREVAALPGMKHMPGPPTIMFPPNGATVGLPQEGQSDPVVLRAEGGTSPLRWIVDGEILPETPRYEQTYLSPKSEGFSRITVVDADGRAATSIVRFKRDQ